MDIVFVLCILCKILIFFLCWRTIGYLGYLLAIIYLLYAVVKTIRLGIYSHINFGILTKACIIMILLLIPNAALQEQKFEILQEKYEMKAMEIIENIRDTEGGFYQTYQLDMLDRLVFNDLEKSVTVYRYEDEYVVSFVKSITFFNQYAYVYLSEPEAISLATTPSKYDSQLSDSNAYDNIEWIEPGKWALIKWY